MLVASQQALRWGLGALMSLVLVAVLLEAGSATVGAGVVR